MMGMDPRDIHAAPREPAPGKVAEQDLDRLLALVARGDEAAFEAVYDRLAGAAYGLIRKVVRDPAQCLVRRVDPRELAVRLNFDRLTVPGQPACGDVQHMVDHGSHSRRWVQAR